MIVEEGIRIIEAVVETVSGVVMKGEEIAVKGEILVILAGKKEEMIGSAQNAKTTILLGGIPVIVARRKGQAILVVDTVVKAVVRVEAIEEATKEVTEAKDEAVIVVKDVVDVEAIEEGARETSVTIIAAELAIGVTVMETLRKVVAITGKRKVQTTLSRKREMIEIKESCHNQNKTFHRFFHPFSLNNSYNQGTVANQNLIF